jgi:hypothetical protein
MATALATLALLVVSQTAAVENRGAWTGTVGLNFILVTGNADTLTLSSNGAFERRWEDWVLGGKFSGIYGQSRASVSAAESVVALAAAGQLRGDRKVSGITSVFLLGGADTDHVKSIELRMTGEGGFAVNWIERKEEAQTTLLLRTDLGARYQRDNRFQYYPTRMDLPDVTFVAPSLGLGFRYALNKEVSIVEEAQVASNIVGDSRVITGSLSRLVAHVVAGLSFSTSFQINYDSKPAAGKKRADTILSAGLELAL